VYHRARYWALFFFYSTLTTYHSALNFFLFFSQTTLHWLPQINLDEIYDFVNIEFQKLCTYFRDNKLLLHPDKTKYLLISPNQNVTCDRKIYINKNNLGEQNQQHIFELHRVTSTDKTPAIKYLGVYFDKNLNFKYHISQISKKLSHAIYSLKAAKNIFSEKHLRTLYFSLFHCHLTYALEVWSSVSPAQLQPLIKKQKTGIRVVGGGGDTMTTPNLSSNLSLSYCSG
jgi:hypothetical protein